MNIINIIDGQIFQLIVSTTGTPKKYSYMKTYTRYPVLCSHILFYLNRNKQF